MRVVDPGVPGSPPRAWGRRHDVALRILWQRFTPTCVGTTTCTCPPQFGHSGSPPRAWGRPAQPAPHLARIRFTPTCVGTTGRGARAPADRGGSPPRAWGRLEGRAAVVLRRRFTPTCVGTTPAVYPGSPRRTVHPHVRGDDASSSAMRAAAAGSPPRAWGRRILQLLRSLAARFTPTCVGTT